MAAGTLRPERLTTHRFALDDAAAGLRAARVRRSRRSASCCATGDDTEAGLAQRPPRTAARRRRSARHARGSASIGAGAFARTVLLPHARQASPRSPPSITATGPSARATAERFGARARDHGPGAGARVRRHRRRRHRDPPRHATPTTPRARCEAGKHVFVEKPLALDEDELAGGRGGRRGPRRACSMVGFNRRFAPLAAQLRDELGGAARCSITYRVNAGRLPRSHWTHDPQVGGGRIVGEVCHFVDFAERSWPAVRRRVRGAVAVERQLGAARGHVAATLSFADGSVAHDRLRRARRPVAAQGARRGARRGAARACSTTSASCDCTAAGAARRTAATRDKGHAAELARFAEACRTGRAAVAGRRAWRRSCGRRSRSATPSQRNGARRARARREPVLPPRGRRDAEPARHVRRRARRRAAIA